MGVHVGVRVCVRVSLQTHSFTFTNPRTHTCTHMYPPSSRNLAPTRSYLTLPFPMPTIFPVVSFFVLSPFLENKQLLDKMARRMLTVVPVLFLGLASGAEIHDNEVQFPGAFNVT